MGTCSQDSQIVTSSIKPVLEVPELDDEEVYEFLQFIRTQKGVRTLNNWKKDIAKLLIVALPKNEAAAKIL